MRNQDTLIKTDRNSKTKFTLMMARTTANIFKMFVPYVTNSMTSQLNEAWFLGFFFILQTFRCTIDEL